MRKQFQNRRRIAVAALCVALIGGCAKTATLDTSTTDTPQIRADSAPQFAEPIFQTVKTGAAIALNAEQAFAVAPGENGRLDIAVLENYSNGTLTLDARGTDSLEVFGANRNLNVDMATAQEHSWSLDFNGLTDGVHYISVTATARPLDGIATSRAFSLRVEVGDLSQAAAKLNATRQLQQLPSGETARVMQAEETIN